MFDPEKLYRCNDPDLLALAPYSTLAHMRSEGRGPAFLKVGGRVLWREPLQTAASREDPLVPTHVTARLAWHSDGWNGAVCKAPEENTYCVG